MLLAQKFDISIANTIFMLIWFVGIHTVVIEPFNRLDNRMDFAKRNHSIGALALNGRNELITFSHII